MSDIALTDLATFFTQQFDLPVVILDLETTGGNFMHDRITEMAFLHFWQGKITHFTQLVNPQMPISDFVSNLTGIDNAMVANAPIWADVLPQVLPYLRGSLLIAHNSRFDYTFLRHECQRIGVPFATTVLCTVQLSRKLYPQFHKHSLDSIIERHHLQVTSRHRAMADVMVLAQFLQVALQERGMGAWRECALQLLHPRRLPAHLSPHLHAQMETFSDGFGISIWRNAAGQIVNVLTHEHAYREVVDVLHRLPVWAKSVVDLAFVPAIGSLHAAVLRAQMVQAANLNVDDSLARWTVMVVDDAGVMKMRVRPMRAGCLQHAPHGVFMYPKAAKRELLTWAKRHGLCPNLLGVLPHELPKNAPCPVISSGQTCSIACQTQNAILHNDTVQAALNDLPVCDWGKWRGGIIQEYDALSGQKMRFVCQHGAVQLDDGTWYVDANILAIVKQKIKQKAVQFDN